MKNKFSFELQDLETADVVIKKVLEGIAEETRGYVSGHVEIYDGPINSYTYTKKTGLGMALTGMTSEEVTVDIQEKLGELNTDENKFEVYLSVKGLEHYKFRMMFISYSTISYPVTVVMNSDIGIAYAGKRSGGFKFDSMNEVQEMITKVMESNYMISLVQSLINEALRQERKEV